MIVLYSSHTLNGKSDPKKPGYNSNGLFCDTSDSSSSMGKVTHEHQINILMGCYVFLVIALYRLCTFIKIQVVFSGTLGYSNKGSLMHLITSILF